VGLDGHFATMVRGNKVKQPAVGLIATATTRRFTRSSGINGENVVKVVGYEEQREQSDGGVVVALLPLTGRRVKQGNKMKQKSFSSSSAPARAAGQAQIGRAHV